MRANFTLKLCAGDRSRLCYFNSWRFVSFRRRLSLQPFKSREPHNVLKREALFTNGNVDLAGTTREKTIFQANGSEWDLLALSSSGKPARQPRGAQQR